MASVALNIGVLHSSSRVRGIGRYVYDLARGIDALEPSQPEVVGLALTDVHGGAKLYPQLGAAAEQLRNGGVPMISHARWAYRQRFGLQRAAKRAGVALVHSGHPEATPLTLGGLRRVVTCHDLIPFRYPQFYTGWREGYARGRAFIDRRRYTRADHIIAVSRATADDLVRLLGIAADRISVVHNGVDISGWSTEAAAADQPLRARLGVADAPYMLYVGAGDWRKNTVAMVASLARARQQPGCRDLQLVWAGSMGKYWITEVMQAAHVLGMSQAVKLLGYVDDATLGALYRGALGQLFVSRAEGFGYPVVEAMACGCPVVAADRSSTFEIAEGAALTVPPEDHPAIADAIVRLARESGLRQQLRELGLARANELNMQRMAEQTLAVYRALL